MAAPDLGQCADWSTVCPGLRLAVIDVADADLRAVRMRAAGVGTVIDAAGDGVADIHLDREGILVRLVGSTRVVAALLAQQLRPMVADVLGEEISLAALRLPPAEDLEAGIASKRGLRVSKADVRTLARYKITHEQLKRKGSVPALCVVALDAGRGSVVAGRPAEALDVFEQRAGLGRRARQAARGLAAPQCQPAVPNAIDTPQQHQPSTQQPGTTWLIAQPHARAVSPVA